MMKAIASPLFLVPMMFDEHFPKFLADRVDEGI
jgi:hypothetical protein